ncbi:MAG: hypothetical protein OXT65_02590 [Alphaproteobacteria bacterium]|nr:hypothetical protein [Alphaproteobacteria bacterium]
MINRLLMKLGLGDGSLNVETDSRRQHVRFPGVDADIVVRGQVYDIQDWGLGGTAFGMVDAGVRAGEVLDVTLRFRFSHETISVGHRARILRTGRMGTAASFLPDDLARRQMERAVDYRNTQDFLDSQVA